MPRAHPQTEDIIEALMEEVPAKIICHRFKCGPMTVYDIRRQYLEKVWVRRAVKAKYRRRTAVQLDFDF